MSGKGNPGFVQPENFRIIPIKSLISSGYLHLQAAIGFFDGSIDCRLGQFTAERVVSLRQLGDHGVIEFAFGAAELVSIGRSRSFHSFRQRKQEKDSSKKGSQALLHENTPFAHSIRVRKIQSLL